MSAVLLACLCLLPVPELAEPGRLVAQDDDQPVFVESVVRLPLEDTGVVLADLDGDGGLDLIDVDPGGLGVRTLGADGILAGASKRLLAWEGSRLGWDVGDVDGDDAAEVVVVFPDGTVRAYGPADSPTPLDEGRVVLSDEALLPAGVHRVRVLRDVDRDGRLDIVLPASGAHRIHLARGDSWAPPLEVAFRLDASYDVGDPESLSSSFGQEVRVPWFRLEDVDGDGRDDLVSRTRGRIAFHLAAPELSAEPSWVLDLESLRAELPRRRDIDLDNLFSALDARVDWRVADLDGEYPNDLLVSLGPKFRLYLGGSMTGPRGNPDQVLKSSGNVLMHSLRQVQGDELPDLQVIRGERISVGRVLRSIILPSSLDFDVFTYQNEGGSFSRSPTRRNQISIQIPRLLSFMGEDGDAFEAAIDAQFEVRAVRLPRALGEPAAGDDVADLVDSELLLYRGCAPEPTFLEQQEPEDFDGFGFIEGLYLADLDQREDGASLTIDLGDIDTFDFAPGALLRRSHEGRSPDARHPLAMDPDSVRDTRVLDLDGDSRADVIVVSENEDAKEWVLQFLLVR